MLNHVRSQAHNDCGVCALACMTGFDWQQVDDVLWPSAQKPKARNTTGKQLISVAPFLGWMSSQKVLKPLRSMNWKDVLSNIPSLAQRAIVKVQYADSRCAHWVVFDGKWVYDSNDGIFAVEHFRYQPLGYIIFEKM